jgi:TonB family protein
MSSVNAVASPLQAGRRSHPRRRIDGLSYVEFGSDNGAILIDIGEGGMGFQSVMPVCLNQALLFKFRLPGAAVYLEGFAEVAWMNQSGKGGGLRFVDVDEAVACQIRDWTSVLSGSESSGLKNENGTEPDLADDSPAETATDVALVAATPLDAAPINVAPVDATPVDATHAVHAAEANNEAALLAIILEAAAAAETAEISSIESAEIPSAISESEGSEVESEPPADQTVAAQAPAHLSPAPAALLIPEFTIEATPAPDSIMPPAIPIELARTPAQISVQNEVLPFSAHSADNASGFPSQKESAPIAAHSATSPKPAGLPAPYSKLDSKLDSKNLVSAKRRQQKPVPAKPAIPAPPAYGQESALRGSSVRHSQAPAIIGWENFIATEAAKSKPQSLLPQALKTAIGAAAGACLVLAFVLGLPYLKAQVQATANVRSASSSLGNPSAFEVEVADVNNRRWILRSGGEAGSPFGDATSKRETQPAAPSAARKSSQPDDSATSVETAVETQQPKLARPGELALSRPRATNNGVASAQPLAPSIFDGITPPIGSVTDRLATGGPEAPRIVPAESGSMVRKSTLQAAVLVQRVAPVYPSTALQSQVQGEVLVSATIGKDGIPRNLTVIRGDQRLIAAALAAIRQWRYRPATLAGDPIETQIQITIDFHLK